MVYGQHGELMAVGYATANDFKNAMTFKLQAVIFGEKVKELFILYVTKLYKLVSKTQEPQYEDPLWLTYDGAAECNIGRLVSRFFENELNIHITTTTIRSVVETTSAQQLENGSISVAQRAAVTAVNTHSSVIANDHYVRTELGRTVQLAKEAFAGGIAVPAASPLPPPLPEVWGADHPDGPDVQRARWTAAEKQYLKQVHAALLTAATKPRILSLCLRRIREDPCARAIFHVRHVMSTDRLKAGLTADAEVV